jgi:uncharacterized damage-inducible protein DinB
VRIVVTLFGRISTLNCNSEEFFMPAAATTTLDLSESILQSFAVNEKVNQLLLKNVSPGAWRAEPLGKTGRAIAEIFAHIHNVRLMWLKAAAPDAPQPDKLERLTCTPSEVSTALAESAQACSSLIRLALATPGGRVKNFKPDAVHFTAYLMSHEAHHRGQITQPARQAGYPLPKQTGFAMWEWGTLAKTP